MTAELTAQVQYIFLDVVKFTHNRSVEAQSHVISCLNNIVKHCISYASIPQDKIIYLPTGDGICIALLNINEPYDLAVKIALDILSKIFDHNNEMGDNMRKFQVRIGLNSNIDNVITDINGNENVAGAGINYAQRVMNCGDGSQILVGQSIYDILRQREEYMKSFRCFQARIKHDQGLNIYQFIKENYPGLNNEIPEQFKLAQKREPKLTKLVAYYFAHAISKKEFIKNKKGGGQNEYSCVILLWYLASDSVGYSEATDFSSYQPKLYGANPDNIDDAWEYYQNIEFWVICELSEFIIHKHLSPYMVYFEASFGHRSVPFINLEGRRKLKKEWPDIWDEFDLDQYIEK